MAERASGNYSHRLAAWLGTRLLAGIGAPPLTVYGSGRLNRLSYETGLLLAETAAGGRTAVEARRTLQVSPFADTAFAYTAHALVTHHLEPGRREDRLVVALGPEANQPVRTQLPEFLEAVRRAAPGASTARLSLRADPRRVGAVFMKHTAQAWREVSGATPTDDDLRRLVERVVVLERDVYGEGAQAVEARSLLHQLVRDTGQVEAAWDALVEIFAGLAQERGGCDRRGLQERLIAAGVELRTAPDFRRDVTRLSRVTAATWATLEERRLTLPSQNGPVTLPRAATDALERRLARASTLVLGEAGVGKTVVLAHLLNRLREADVPVLALDAETTPANSLEQLQRHLGTTNNLAACLTQWDPQRPGVLAVDALHAADEGQTRAWHSLLATASQAGWRVVVADRVAHLRHEGGLRALFPAASASGRDHTLPEFADLNHVAVTGLTDAELVELTATAPDFQPLFDDPPSGLVDVLRTPFNLRLVGELLQAGIDDRSLRSIRGRLELLQQYSTWVRTPPERTRGRSGRRADPTGHHSSGSTA